MATAGLARWQAADELAAEQAKPTSDAGLEAELLEDLTQNLTKITQHGRQAASIGGC